MKGEAQKLIEFFEGSKKRFIIPLYQRNYDWKEENCEQLFQDLVKLQQSGSRRHFFGSIVSRRDDESADLSIIDGQQRITTVSLLLVAIINACKKKLIEVHSDTLVDEITENYLVDKFHKDTRKVKLKPIKKDMEAFDNILLKDENSYVKESNITRNYQFLFNKVVNSDISADDLVEAVGKLEIINITLGADDDPQLIFESLNSTGLDLSESDKIRNYLLMSLSPTEQDELYTRHWNPIEELTGYDPSPFVRDYLTMKRGKIERIDKTYTVFKEYVETNGMQRAGLLEDLHYFAGIYCSVRNAKMGSKKLDRKLEQLKNLDSTVAYPFYMSFFDYARHTEMSDDEKCKVLDVVEAYWARRIICNQPSNALNKVFATLHRDVLSRMDKSDNSGGVPSYLSILVYVFLRKGGSAVFPTDGEVEMNFRTRQVYLSNARTFLIERLENQDSSERHDVVAELKSKDISIEHIMPQTLSDKWKIALGKDWERIHQQYLHTMANLTLTGYNSQYSNLGFAEKRDMEKGFKDSAYRLNNSVKSCNQWTEKELKQRQALLLGVFLRLWPMPSTDFIPAGTDAESAMLDDEDTEFTGRKLLAYTLNGMRYSATTWKDMLIKVCSILANEKRPTMEWLCANETISGLSSTSKNYYTKIADCIYIWADCSTITKIDLLRDIFRKGGFDASELKFEFRPDEDNI